MNEYSVKKAKHKKRTRGETLSLGINSCVCKIPFDNCKCQFAYKCLSLHLRRNCLLKKVQIPEGIILFLSNIICDFVTSNQCQQKVCFSKRNSRKGELN